METSSDKILLRLKDNFTDLKNIKEITKKNFYCPIRCKVTYKVIINPIELTFSNLKNLELEFDTDQQREAFLMDLENKLNEHKIVIK